MSQTNEHDVIVVGAGPAGDRAATLAAGEGLDVAQVERERVGGECAYWACMPSKALLRPGELLAELARVPGLPGAAGGTDAAGGADGDGRAGRADGSLDVAQILARRDEVIHGLDDRSHAERQIGRGITLYRGHGRLDGERCVRVEASDGSRLELRARRAVILAVGSGAELPPIPGLAELSPWTNREATTATAAPASLLVLGGGPVGCELAQAWASLGSAVTLIETGAQVLAEAEPFAGDLVAASLRQRGVAVRTATTAIRVARDATGRWRLEVDSGETLRAAELLVCVGRSPHTGDLGLETVDLAPGAVIEVDATMRVPRRGGWLYAIGDVNGRALLTQAGKYQAQIAVANIMNRAARADWDGQLTPQVVFTDPQVAAVGYTLAQALAAGIPARAVDADPGATPGSSFIGRGSPSAARIVVDTAREVMIGATFVGPELAESLQAASFAIVGEVPLSRLVHAMPAYPTRSEVWLELLAPWRP